MNVAILEQIEHEEKVKITLVNQYYIDSGFWID